MKKRQQLTEKPRLVSTIVCVEPTWSHHGPKKWGVDMVWILSCSALLYVWAKGAESNAYRKESFYRYERV